MRNVTPACVGIILDGNRRWAKEQGLPVFEGHRRGMNNIEPIVLAGRDIGVKHIVVYAFSTENWNRETMEVSYLMQLFEEMAQNALLHLTLQNIKVCFIGQRERFSEHLQKLMQTVEDTVPENIQTTLWVCLSYGGRADIVQATNALIASGEAVTEDSLSGALWGSIMPEPDIIIRTGGEHRLSNFLLWQSAYSELFFPQQYWPGFTKEDLKTIVQEYTTRERRKGK